MRRVFTKSLFLGTICSFGMLSGLSAQDYYHGNSTWENKSDYLPIIEENFQNWNFTDDSGAGLKKPETNSCAVGGNARADRDNYATFEVKRSVDAKQNKPNGKVSFFLDYCQIQPDCDTQSGTNYTLNPEATGGDYRGPSINKVSIGCVNIYDNYEGDRPTTMGVGGDGSGSFTTSKIPLLERVQYTTSSYGSKRGFNLEIGYDLGDGTVYWDTVRYVVGNSVNSPLNKPEEILGKNMDETNRGMVWEETFSPVIENVYVRIRPTKDNRQIVRLHDFKLYGEAPSEDDGQNPNNPTSIDNINASRIVIVGFGGIYTVSEEANVFVYDVTGNRVMTAKNAQQVDLRSLSKGIYLIQAVTPNGGKVTKKVII